MGILRSLHFQDSIIFTDQDDSWNVSQGFVSRCSTETQALDWMDFLPSKQDVFFVFDFIFYHMSVNKVVFLKVHKNCLKFKTERKKHLRRN